MTDKIKVRLGSEKYRSSDDFVHGAEKAINNSCFNSSILSTYLFLKVS